MYKDLGDYQAARDLLISALDLDIENFGEQHPSTAISCFNVATVYQNLGETEKAKHLFEKAYFTFNFLLGNNHPNTKIVKRWLDNF